jgi:fumarylacetoacetase
MDRSIIPADARTWVEGAQETDFPIQNIPFGTALLPNGEEALVAAIGDHVLALQELLEAGLLDERAYPALNGFYDLPDGSLPGLRRRLAEILDIHNDSLRDDKRLKKKALLAMSEVKMQVPIPPGSFVDFYSGIHHASNVGRMFRPDQPALLPNYRHLPIGYNGRANTVVASGEKIIRPKGQTMAKDADGPEFGPTRELDFELEMGFYIGDGQPMGKRITCKAAEEHILGLVLCNDWSARDFQRWEYQPLGPFLAKSFATQVSPWVVLLDALEPFRIEGEEQDPPVLPHLRRQGRQHFDIELEALLQTPSMPAPQVIARSNTRHLYWSMAQQIAHQTSNGTPIEFGDLMASGTISGPEPTERGSLLELTWRGTEPLVLGEEQRTFLEDGDVLILRAAAHGEGFRIGFGECRGEVGPAV